MPCSAKYVLEVSKHVSPKATTKGSFRDKKTPEKIAFLRVECDQKIKAFLTNLGRSYLVQLHIFWN